MPLLKDGKIIENHWISAPLEGDIPEGDVILPLALWKSRRAEFLGRNSRIGLQLEPADLLTEIAADLDKFTLIALNFPASKDGRAFSSARLLRERYHFKGEIRAVGHFSFDQMSYLKRCGFDAFDLPEGRDIAGSIKALDDFTVFYQAAADQPLPLYRRR